LASLTGFLSALPGGRRLRQFVGFCLVGASGVLVDSIVLHVLVWWAGWGVGPSKILAAEAALLSNFFLNETWTFRGALSASEPKTWFGPRLLKFQAICSAGIVLAVLLIRLFYGRLGLQLYLANILAIVIVTAWNFILNVLCTWSPGPAHGHARPSPRP